MGHQNLLTWSRIRTVLIPIHTSKLHDQENLEGKEGTCRVTMGIVTTPNNKIPPWPQMEEKPSPETAGGPPFQARGEKLCF